MCLFYFEVVLHIVFATKKVFLNVYYVYILPVCVVCSQKGSVAWGQQKLGTMKRTRFLQWLQKYTTGHNM